MSTQLNLKSGVLALIALGGLALGSGTALAVEAAPAPATMQQVYSAPTLFTCPMHAAVVSADPKQDCPLCGMHLAAMSAEARATLVTQKLVGCPMDPIVVKAEGAANCPVCGMKLTALLPPAPGAKPTGAQEGAAAPAAPGCCKAAAGAAPAAGCCQGAAPAAAGCCKSAAGAEHAAPGDHKH